MLALSISKDNIGFRRYPNINIKVTKAFGKTLSAVRQVKHLKPLVFIHFPPFFCLEVVLANKSRLLESLLTSFVFAHQTAITRGSK